MALLMVMGLSLLIYALAEHHLRQQLVEQDLTIPDQKGRPTQNPTMRRVFQMFEGIHLLTIQTNAFRQRMVTNVTELHLQMNVGIMKSQIVTNSPYPNLHIDAVINTTLLTVSKSSARIYSQTYTNWIDWCQNYDIHPLDLRPQIVYEFLIDQPVTIATRKRHLAAFRKLARVLALDMKHPEFKTLYEGLRLLKTPTEETAGEERIRRTLRPQEVWKILETWDGDAPLQARNKALLSVLFYTGMRRAEVIALKWQDVDWLSDIKSAKSIDSVLHGMHLL